MIDGTDAYIMDLMCGKYTTKQERRAGRLFKAVYSQAYDKYGSAYNKKRNGAHMAWQADFSQGAQVRLMADGEPTEYYMTYVGKNIWNEGDKTVYWTLWSEYQCAPVLTASREECCECAGVPCMKKKTDSGNSRIMEGMKMGWKNNYHPAEYNGRFDCADGEHRMTIVEAKDAVSKASGNNMIAVAIKVEGGNGINYMHFINEGQYFDGNMTQFFDCFGIDRGNFNYAIWRNKVGRGTFYHEERVVDAAHSKDGQEHKYNDCRCRLITPDDVPPIQRYPVQQSGYQQPTAPNTTQTLGPDGMPFMEDIPF